MKFPAKLDKKTKKSRKNNALSLESMESRTLFSGSVITTLVFITDPAALGKPTLSHFTVEAEDGVGNKLTKEHGPVTLTITSGGPSNGTLAGTLTVNLKNGVAHFNNVILRTPGNFSLTATEPTANGTNVGVSKSFQVDALVPAKLKIVSVYPPNNFHPVSGQLGPVTVDVLTTKGYIATNFNSGSALSNSTSNGSSNGTSNGTSNVTAPTITLTLTSTLSTETTFGTPTNVLTITQNATAGVAVFTTTALTAQTPGWYRLTVSAGNLTGQSELVFIR